MIQQIIPLVIGIAGGTGSGKTTVSKVILDRVGIDQVAYIMHDSYYKDLSDLPLNQRTAVNFDHPNSLDTDLMIEHVRELKAGRAVRVPTYDFTTHSRTGKTILVESRPVILVEGILIFLEAELRDLFDVKLFVDTDADIRFIRRLQRDITERGRTTESVIHQYQTTVRPMHLRFVEPSRRYADVIIPEGGFNEVAMDMVIARIESLLRVHKKQKKKKQKDES
jgi:uridine kinase